MRIRRLWLVVVVLFMPTAARAHDHTADFFGGFSYADASKLWGFHTQLGTTLPWLDYDLSAVGDLTIHVGTHDRADLTRVTFLGGLRYTPTKTRLLKNVVSFHALLGGVHDADADSSNDLALAVGVGWEYLPKGKDSAAGWGVKVQADYAFSQGESFPRVSAGVVYRIKKP
ncbi:MAG: hypothetical protein ACRD2N_18595 [Vicinamibacterales bacterium]